MSGVPKSIFDILPFLKNFKRYTSKALLSIIIIIIFGGVIMNIIVHASVRQRWSKTTTIKANQVEEKTHYGNYSDCVCLENELPNKSETYFSLEPLFRTTSLP